MEIYFEKMEMKKKKKNRELDKANETIQNIFKFLTVLTVAAQPRRASKSHKRGNSSNAS
jgi:hypothetical protein